MLKPGGCDDDGGDADGDDGDRDGDGDGDGDDGDDDDDRDGGGDEQLTVPPRLLLYYPACQQHPPQSEREVRNSILKLKEL